MKLYIIKFAASPSAGRLEHVLDRAVSSLDIPVVTEYITSTEQFSDLADKGKLQSSRLIFAVETDISGINPEACKLLRYLRLKSIYPAAPAPTTIVTTGMDCQITSLLWYAILIKR